MRRSEIIAAALKVFARKGFHNTRAEDVAAQAHIAKGTLYLYFDSKEAIYQAALTHAMEQLNALVQERLVAVTSAADRVRVFVGARLEFWGKQSELYRMILTLGREKKQRKQTTALLNESVEQLQGILRDGITAGELKKRPVTVIAWAAMDMIRGTTERRIDGHAEGSLEEELEMIVGIVKRHFSE
jgi:AcrR family transcriptional regulator